MWIRGVRVERVGTIVEPIALEFGRGLNLIHGPNESGKTTLLRALRAAFTTRAKVSGRELEVLRSRADGHPEVQVEFELGEACYTIEKRFAGARGTTRLTARVGTRIEELRGEEAEARLRELLGLPSARRGGVELGIWPLVWVEQGQSAEEPVTRLSALGCETIGARLGALSGTVLAGSEEASALHERVRVHAGRFFTETGRPSRSGDAPLFAAQARLAEVERERASLEELSTQHDDRLAAYFRLEEALRDVARELGLARADVAASTTRVAAARELTEAHREAGTEATRVRAELERHLGLQRERAAVVREEESARDARREAVADCERRAAALERLRAELAALEAKRDERARRQVEDERRVERLELIEQRAKLGAELEERVRRARELAEEAARLAALRARHAVVGPSPEQVEELEALERAIEREELVLGGAAPIVRLRALKPVELELDGARCTLGRDEALERAIVSRLAIELPGLFALEVDAGLAIAERTEALAHRRAARDTKRQALGVSSVEAARQQLEERAQLARELAHQERIVQSLRSEPDEVRAGRLEALTSACARLDARLGALAGAEPITSTVRELEPAREALRTAAGQLAEIREACSASGAACASVAAELEAARAREAAAARAGEEAAERYALHLATHGEAAPLAARVGALQLEWATRTARASELERALQALVPEEAERAHEAATRKLMLLEAQERALQDERLQLEAALEEGQATGLHEKRARTGQQVLEQRAQVAALEEEAEAARLLLEMFERCRTETRRAFLAPLRRELEPMIRLFFEEAMLELDEELRVRSLVRPAAGEDDFVTLSGGAREQLGVIVRLGLAQVLAGDGTLPFLLDDAFGFTDDNRFGRIVAVLQHAVKRLQLIVSTCHVERYTRLGLAADHVHDLGALRSQGRARAAAS